jgi:hypothetical protein
MIGEQGMVPQPQVYCTGSSRGTSYIVAAIWDITKCDGGEEPC